MMRPIADSGEPRTGPYVFAGERRLSSARDLGPADRELFMRAADAGSHGDWAGARALAAQIRDPVARRLVEWAYLLDRGSGASFGAIANFLSGSPDWPARDTLFARAEEAMSPAMNPQAVLAWFGGRTPQTGIGKVRLAEALIATGAADRGHSLIREAWISDTFEPDQEIYVEAHHADVLNPAAESARLDRLLARNDVTAARREIPRLDPAAQRLASVRLLLRSNPVQGEAAIASLPVSLQSDPGLLFDEAHALRQRNDLAPVPALLARAAAGGLSTIEPARWWAELNADARAELGQHDDRNAYALCVNAGLPRDTAQYAESQFLAGWIALRRLGDPADALTHFNNLLSAVSRPISRARARYWLGRAREATGDVSTAVEDYSAAARDSATFYGQLALARLSANSPLHLASSALDANAARDSYDRSDLRSAIRVLADTGFAALVREFALRDAELHPDPASLKALAEDVSRRGYPDAAVRIAKTASYSGTLLYEYSHPVIAVPRYSGPGLAPETALVLAVIRQETEFDPASVSGPGARGIMPVMPDEVVHLARLSGLPYDFAALTSDPNYNMELGMTELSHEIAEWGGSYVLTAAAYNAGPGNVRKWIAAFGDPRDARIDPVDWIEQIPFEETRNYVERVLENIEVYRDRLAGRDEPLQILADLYRPDAPQMAPLRAAARQTIASTPAPVSRALSADPPPDVIPREKPAP